GAVELDDTDVSHRAAGSATWLYMIERMPGLLAACRNNRFLAVSCLKLHITLEQVNGGAIRLATGEQNLAWRKMHHPLLVKQAVQVVARQGIHRHKGLQQALVY